MSPVGGPVVLVTGAAGGIGRAIARRYAREGAALVLVDVDEAGLSALSDELLSAQTRVLALACDITDREACDGCVRSAVEAFGAIHILVNNAGITHLGSVAETDGAVFRRVMEVNYFGSVNVTQAVLPVMLRQAAGKIAVVSSVAGFAPLSGRSGYAASKHALHGFFESLRGEVRRAGIDVTMVCPTFTRTEIGAGALGADGAPAALERTETGEILEPEGVAEALYRGVARSRRLVVVGTTGRLAHLLMRFAPALYERLMVKRMLFSGHEDRVHR